MTAQTAYETEGIGDCDTQPMFHRALRADPQDVRQTLMDLQERLRGSFDPDLLGRLELVLAEIMNNVAEHGRYTGPDRSVPFIHLCIVPLARGISCAICDDGDIMPANCLQIDSLPETGPELPEGGFGWFLIQDLTQSLIHFREGRRNFLAFTLPFDHADIVTKTDET